MRRLSLIVVGAAGVAAAVSFWGRSGADSGAGAEAEPDAPAEPAPPPVAPEPTADKPPPAAKAPGAAPAAPAPPPGDGAAPANARAALARQQMQSLRQSATHYTPHELSLYVRLTRAGVVPPPETKALIDRRKAGATAAELEAYVRDAFPEDARVQAAAVQWIHSGAQTTPAAPP